MTVLPMQGCKGTVASCCLTAAFSAVTDLQGRGLVQEAGCEHEICNELELCLPGLSVYRALQQHLPC